MLKVAQCVFGDNKAKTYSYLIPPYLEGKIEKGDWVVVLGPRDTHFIVIECVGLTEIEPPKFPLKTVIDVVDLRSYAEHMGVPLE